MSHESTMQEILDGYPIAAVAEEMLKELEVSEQIPLASGPGGGGSGGRSYSKKVRAWRYLCGELYLLLCTDDLKYKEERNKIRTGGGFVISVLTGLLVSKFGLEAGVASSMVALALLVPLRIGIEAWGKSFKDGKDRKGYLAGERETLILLADFLSKANSNNIAERRAAIGSFCDYDIPAELAIPVLIPLLDDEDDQVRFIAVIQIERYGELAHDAIPGLLKALKDDFPATRQRAYSALRKFRSDGKTIVPVLVEALTKITDLGEYRSNLVSLSSFGKEAESGVPAIEKIIQDEEAAGRGSGTAYRHERELYETAVWALQKIKELPNDTSDS